MKKTIVLVLALLSWQLTQADVVTVDQARSRAARFFTAAEIRTKATAVRPEDFKLIGTFPDIATKSSAEAPAMYIFERPSGGYAIVSGDDVARPVLGYSLDGHFPVSDMPDNMRALLQWYADIIAYARDQGWESTPDVEAGSGLDPANSVLLQTAQWSQDHPFNDLVSEINGHKPPIGCVATATAIVMHYHKWPERGTGILPSYDYDGIHVEGFALGHSYDWDKMPDDYRNCTEEEAACIARLLYDVAVMYMMSFRLGGSGASLVYSVERLPEYFGYDKQIHYFERCNGYTDGQWERSIVNEINAGRPVLYDGGSPGGGHAFVIDGYNGRYFSINYGWGGFSNGFFRVTPVDGHYEELLEYYLDQGMVNGVVPDQGGKPVPVMFAEGEATLPYDFAIGEEFSLSFHVRNTSPGSTVADFRYALYDRNDIVKEVISSVIHMKIDVVEWVTQKCRITKPLADGDKVLLTMRDPNTGEWTPVVQSLFTIIGFTERPLSELMEIGYNVEPEYIDGRPNIERDFFIKAHKDVWWGIYDSSNNELMINEHLPNGRDWSNIDSQVSWHIKDHGSDGITQSDIGLYEIWLPSGKYVLRCKNPLTQEKMEIKLEL